MLEILNRYAHGFVVVPVVLACRKGGVFNALDDGPRSAEELGDQLGANLGHLQVALRLLESLGWIDHRTDGRYEANLSVADQRLVPDNLSTLIQADVDAYLREGTGGFLTPWIDQIRTRWNLENELLADFFDSLLIVPILAHLSKRGLLKDLPRRDFSDLPKGVRAEVIVLLEVLGWLQGSEGSYTLTAPGDFMFERAMNLGVSESYRPMLAAMDKLLFGDAQRVFAHDSNGHETHVDRAMNVISSGFQHDRYFAEVEQILISIFSREPLSSQPRYVADMGSGDGTLLKRVYRTVREKTPRGKRLSEYPLTLIGIDLNQVSLGETSRTLSGIDHIVVTGDIGNPRKVVENLKALGVEPEGVLHIRSFLDHDRPYIPPADGASLLARSRARYLGAYADRQGNAIPPAAAVQSLVENLQRWAEVVTEHGLILLEVHCQDPRVVRAHIDQTESLYFDAIEGFSQQLLIEADVALMAAAEAGLFPRRELFRKYPGFLPYCRITLNLFERRPYRVRLARLSDLPALLRLEQACWPEPMCVTGEELQRRIVSYALGQWVLEIDGQIVGAVYSQRIADVEHLRDCKLQNVSGLADENGGVVQLLGLNVLPEMQHLGLGDQLLDLMLMRSALQGGVRQVAGITRCKNFHGQSLDEFARYVDERDASGSPVDPILQFHHRHGAKFLTMVADYRAEDADNLGAGVLLCYDLGVPGTAPTAKSQIIGSRKSAATDLKSQLETCLQTLLGPSRHAAFSWKRPLREMGLDSLSLLEFRTLLQQTFGRPFSPTFFFSHPTLLDILRYLEESSTEPAHSASTQATERVNLERRVTPAAASPTRGRETATSPAGHQGLIAVIGMAGRFPGCADLQEYWDMLANARDAVTEIPAERWNVDQYYSADPDAIGKIVSREGGFLRKVDEFDAAFFNISPREAELMDPQQRLLLEMHWEALEDAGIDPERLRRAECGIFVGLYSHDYELLQVAGGTENDLGAHFATGNAASIASGRLAYFLGTRGAAITIDTACSSSLVAAHQAVRSLRHGECDIAMASGVNLILSPRASIAFSRAGMLSPQGRCKTFDAAADGYVRSEGCGVVVLKRLDDAVRDEDSILAVIRGSAVNQDGASNGLTAPSVPAQEALIRGALKDARLRPADIDYVEAHGTGTQLGDPVEFQALRNVFRADSKRTEPLWLGSVKTNIGHTEAAAGIAGLIKVVLSMQRQQLPTHLHFHKPNPQIDLESIPARIPVQNERWARQDRPLRAGVSSFGFSGTNAHLILEQAPTPTATSPATDRSTHLLPLSAKSAPALQSLVARFARWVPDHPELDLGDICHAAGAGRAHHDFRIAFTSSTLDGLAHSLQHGLARAATHDRVKDPPKIAFLFTGQGSQYTGMARELSRTDPIFRKAFRECGEILADELAQPLEQILYPETGEPSVLDETANTQPALFAVEYALARTLQHWGVEPNYVMGHSVGEYVAACIAGVFSLRDGLKLIAARGRLMQGLPRDGAMFAILGPADAVAQAVQETSGLVSIAAFNGPTNTVISGRREEVEAIARRLELVGAKAIPLQVSHAFHSDLMEPILPIFREVARMVRFSKPNINFVSNLTGDFAQDEVTKADCWVRHIRQPVQFAKSIRSLAEQGVNIMIEIGPHPVLLAMGQACLQTADSSSVQWLRTLARDASDWDGTLATLGVLYESGVDIDWSRFHSGRKRSRVNLPTYPWQRKRSWLAGSEPGRIKNQSAPPEAPADWFYDVKWIPRCRLSDEAPRQSAEFLPPSAELSAKLRTKAASLVQQHGVDGSGKTLRAVEKLAMSYAFNALAQLGLTEDFAQPVEESLLAERLRIAPQHRRLFGRLVAMLAEDGIVRITSGGLSIDRNHRAAVLPELAAQAALQCPSAEFELALLNRCGINLAAVLRGEEDPLPLLFPVDSRENAEKLYRDSAWARVYNTLIADAIAQAADHLPRGRVLRILEIGAGTGGTTASILGLLPAQRTDYVFTDVSKALLQKSSEAFRGYPFVRYKYLNVEDDPGPQGFAPGQFDIVIAANVVHATRDLHRTLSHIRELLSPRGMLLLLETTEARRWVDLTFGLTTGWWSFADSEIRTQHPLLSRGKWLQLLKTEGFGDVEAIGDENGSEVVFEQHLFVARAQPTASTKTSADKAVSPESPAFRRPGHWLIFADSNGVATAFDQQLRSLGEETTLIASGEMLSPNGSGRGSNYGDLLDGVRQQSRMPLRGVIHLASIDAPRNDSLEPFILENTHRFGCETALHLVQGILQREWSEAPKLWLVTQGLQPMTTSDFTPSVAQAPLWGLGKVIALEHPEIWGGLIDLAANDDPVTAARRIVDEVCRPDGEDEIAFYQGNRLVPRLLPAPLESSSPLSFKADASYLITGGVGKIGLLLAQWLVDNGARSLVLVGRTPLPDRAAWPTLRPGSSDYDRVRAIQAIERDGAHVHVCVSSVSDADAMASLFARFGRDLPALAGLIHAAGVVEPAAIPKTDVSAFERAFRPKISGAWILHELTRHLVLDFFAMFSSAATVWGSRELAAYAAANMFLDALARARRSAGLPAVTINWGWWGGGSTSGHVNEFLEKFGLKAMPTSLALTAFGTVLRSDRVQATVASVDWSLFQPIYEAKRQRPFLSEMRARATTNLDSAKSAPAPDETFLSRLRNQDPQKAKELLKTLVRSKVIEVLHLDPREWIDETQGFFTLGMDSLITGELRGRLQLSLGRKLPATIAFEYPSISALTSFLFDELGLAALPAGSSPQPAAAPIPKTPGPVSSHELEDADLASILDEELTRILNVPPRRDHAE